jgi:MFS family permease
MLETTAHKEREGGENIGEETPTIKGEDGASATPKDIRFWLIIMSLLVATFLSALDLTAISTALPTIAHALNSEDFTWIGNAYSITATSFIPWSGGLANVFGRRPILLGGLVFFAVGSAMCGAAKNMNTMLAGRAFQGVGSGVILSLVEIVLADLVSLSERGGFQGAFGAVWALASATGPLIGGAFATKNYRWLFYMNLPLTACVFAIVALFMNLKTPPGTMKEKLARMDWIGNLVFIPSITIFIIGLVWGGQQFAWDSAHVLAPLIIGGFGLIAWYIIEKYYCEYPTVPFKLLMNRTTLIGYFTTFVHGILALSVFYYWPVYFQAVKGASPVKSAVDFFSVAFVVAPFAMVAGGSISATQIYKPQNIIAWILLTVGPGLMSIIRESTPKREWVPLPIPFSIGIGLLYAATVFPVLAPLPPALAGQALAFLVFVRNFGNILGITVGSTVLTNELGKKLPAEFLKQVPGGVAGAYSAIPLIAHLPEPLRTQVRTAFADSIRAIWLVMIPFGGVGLIAALGMKALKLETETDEKWGIAQKKHEDEEDYAKAGGS